MAVAKSVTDLEVYQLVFALQQEIFDLSKRFPPDERYSLTDQIRRSSRSVGANLCEAWKKRRYPAHFVSKLSDSDGEQEETCHWLRTAVKCGYIELAVGEDIANRYHHVSAMLCKMMDSPDSWCAHYKGK
jgi:four helix bundle protein